MIIYRDNEQEVEIDDAFHQFLLDSLPDNVMINAAESNLALSYVAKKLLKLYPEHAENLIVSSNKVYFLGEDVAFKMDSPFDLFDEAINYIGQCEQDYFLKHSKELIKDLKYIYKGFDFLCEIFPINLFECIRGYFCLVDDETIYIMFFGYREDFK